MFQKAVKFESKLRLSIAGPSGSGKTYSALRIATAIGRTAMVDTEHGSASKYADLFNFDVMELEAPYHPDRFCEAIRAAEDAGYEVVVIDSLSHAWFGTGGLLEIVDEIAKRMKSANSFAAWKDATPIHNRMIETILAAKIHILATMRSKQEYVLEENDKGRKVPRKVGMAPIQRDGMEYEFDVFAEMDLDNNLLIQKTRCPALAGKVFPKPGGEVAGILVDWLKGAIDPATIPATAEQLKRLKVIAKTADETGAAFIAAEIEKGLTAARAAEIIERAEKKAKS